MKHITKGPEPEIFSVWKSKASTEWCPTFELLRGDEKKAVFNSLIREQGGICCYCESELIADDFHIEHLKPQSEFPQFSLDFSNFICSCMRVVEKGSPLHCGNLKGNFCDFSLFISPLDPACENSFIYEYDGRISEEINNTPAKKTIEVLGLSIKKLIDMRAKAIAPFTDEELTDEELKKFVTEYLKGKDGKLNEFHTTIKNLFSEYTT